MSREVMQHALEALEKATRFMTDSDYKRLNETIEVIRAALAEPDVPETDLGDMVEPQVQDSVAWAQVPPAFNDWWDSEYSDPTNPFRLNSAAYWAWAGWCAALAEPQPMPPVPLATAAEQQRTEAAERERIKQANAPEIEKVNAHIKMLETGWRKAFETTQRVADALQIIAAPQRPDGTWNRDREACRQIAAEALGFHHKGHGNE